jgi:flagellin
MTSIKTNNAAMAALQTLRGISSDLQKTQNAVSSGYRISKASDNAAYWSIATTMRSDDGAMSAVSDALGLGAAKVDTAYTAMSNAIDVVTQIKAKIVAATEDGVNKKDVQSDIKQLQDQLLSVAQAASFNGQNWMAAASGGTASVVSSFVRDANGGVSVKSTSYNFDAGASGNVLFGAGTTGVVTTQGILGSAYTIGTATASVYSLDISSMTSGDIAKALSMVESALKTMTTTGAKLGSLSTRIDLQSSFTSSLKKSIESGVGKLVDANMEEESSKLSALQTQQQLAVQSLSIANSSSQSILSLFR